MDRVWTDPATATNTVRVSETAVGTSRRCVRERYPSRLWLHLQLVMSIDDNNDDKKVHIQVALAYFTLWIS